MYKNYIFILFFSYSKEEYLKTIGIQWRESRKLSLDKYRRFMYGVYSDKRNTSNYNIYDYIDPPSQTSISNIYKLSCNISIDFDLKHAQSKEVIYVMCINNCIVKILLIYYI